MVSSRWLGGGCVVVTARGAAGVCLRHRRGGYSRRARRQEGEHLRDRGASSSPIPSLGRASSPSRSRGAGGSRDLSRRRPATSRRPPRRVARVPLSLTAGGGGGARRESSAGGGRARHLAAPSAGRVRVAGASRSSRPAALLPLPLPQLCALHACHDPDAPVARHSTHHLSTAPSRVDARRRRTTTRARQVPGAYELPMAARFLALSQARSLLLAIRRLLGRRGASYRAS